MLERSFLLRKVRHSFLLIPGCFSIKFYLHRENIFETSSLNIARQRQFISTKIQGIISTKKIVVFGGNKTAVLDGPIPVLGMDKEKEEEERNLIVFGGMNNRSS